MLDEQAQLADVDEKDKARLCDLLKMGHCGLCNSEWAAPVLLISKKDGDDQFCVDYHELNKKMKQYSYPMLDMNKCLKGLGKAQFQLKMDFCSGFWLIPLTLEVSKIATFITQQGLFKLTVMPSPMRQLHSSK